MFWCFVKVSLLLFLLNSFMLFFRHGVAGGAGRGVGECFVPPPFTFLQSSKMFLACYYQVLCLLSNNQEEEPEKK